MPTPAHPASLINPKIASTLESSQAKPRWARGWGALLACRREFLRHGLQVLCCSLFIGIVLWMLRPGVLLITQMSYSVSIGIFSWCLIDGGRFFIDQDSPYFFPRGWRAGALIVAGVLFGFLMGTAVGDALGGRSTFNMRHQSAEVFTYMLLFSLAIGVCISFFFYSQGKSVYLQAELEAKSRQTTEAQLKLLQSQLDPHMLFNTLANLRALIAQEPQRAVQMLDQLCDFLRATLSASRTQEHSLQAEFDRLRDYLSLMQIRLGERLSFQLDLPQELANIKVPTLILQSLVENAVLHGLEPKVGGGQINITASKEGSQLVLRVTDDGIGFEPSSAASQAPGGFGLTQVRERLKSKYGDLATIDLIALHAINTTANDAFLSKNTIKNELTALTSGCQATLRLPMPV